MAVSRDADAAGADRWAPRLAWLLAGLAALPAVLVTLLSVVVGGVSLVVRFRRARGEERQQLRWVASAAVVAAAAVPVAMAGIVIESATVVGLAVLGSALVLCLAIAAAILRYRLYDIDRIISRTLAWALLTLLLGAGYATVVLGLGRLLPDSSSLAVAAATLAAAAAFQPLRRPIQAAVDRRFNRRRHDAARIIEGFGGRLRDQVDLDTLTAEGAGRGRPDHAADPGVAVAAPPGRTRPGSRFALIGGLAGLEPQSLTNDLHVVGSVGPATTEAHCSSGGRATSDTGPM
jgi:hypothetical protein